jgi:hypothetical protein
LFVKSYFLLAGLICRYIEQKQEPGESADGRRQNTQLYQLFLGGLAKLREVQAGICVSNPVTQPFGDLLAYIVVRGQQEFSHGNLDLTPLNGGEG